MPARKPTGVTLGFIGSGDAAAASITPLLDDLIEAEGGAIKFILPVTKAHFTEPMQDIVAYAIDKEIAFEAVTDAEATKMRKGPVKEALANASKTHLITRVPGKVIALLANSDNPKLLVLWDDEDEEGLKALDKAMEAEIEARDLTDALALLEADDGEGEGEGEETDPEEAAAAEEAAEDEADPEDAEEDEYQPYTEAELGDLGLPDLKAICEANGIEVPPASRTPTYIKAILAAQVEGEPDEEGGINLPEDATEALDLDLSALPDAMAEVLASFGEDLYVALAGPADADNPEAGPLAIIIERLDKLDRIEQMLGSLGIALDKVTAALAELLEAVAEPEAPSAATQRALEAREGAEGDGEDDKPRRGRPRNDGTPTRERARDSDGNLIKKAPPTGGRPRKDGTQAAPAATKPGVRRIKR